MAQLKFGSAGVTTREIDISGPVENQPTGIPAGIIGTAIKGPAFVPLTFLLNLVKVIQKSLVLLLFLNG